MRKEAARGGRNKDSSAKQRQAAKPGAIEWIAGGISAAATIAMILFLLYQAFSSMAATPELEASVDQVRRVGNAFHVEFQVANQGDATAAAVLVKGRIISGGETIEEREVTFDYVPARSEQNGALIFETDPREHQLELQPHGYKEP